MCIYIYIYIHCTIPCPCFLHISSFHYPMSLFSAHLFIALSHVPVFCTSLHCTIPCPCFLHTYILIALPRATAFFSRLFIALSYTSVICTRICIAFPVDDVISRCVLRYTGGSNITVVGWKKQYASVAKTWSCSFYI